MRQLPIYLLLLGLVSCESVLLGPVGIDDGPYRAEFALPLVDSRVNLTELVGEIDQRVTLSVEADGLLRFNYRDTVPGVSTEEAFAELRTLASTVPLAITRRREAIAFPLPDGTQLSRVDLRSGKLTYRLPNPYDRAVDLTLRVPTLVRDGEAYTVTARLPAYGGSGDPPTLTNTDDPESLAGYQLDFTTDSLVIEYRIDGTDGTPLQPGERTVLLLSDLDFSFIEGYVGRQSYAGVDDDLSIDFFENYLSGEVAFEEPRIRVTVRNGFGVPARAVVEELTVTTVSGEVLPVTGEVVEEGFDFNYPRVPGEVATTTYLITEENSNLQALLAARPVRLDYRISALINPEADASMVGFLSDTSTYSALIEVELPLYGAARDFSISDTFTIDLGREYAGITEATFRVTTDNGMPFALALTGTFSDSLGNPLLDLADGELLVVAAAPVDAAGNATGRGSSTNDLPFSGERLNRLREARQLVLQTTFATTEDGSRPVRITDEQELRVRIGARFTVNNQ